MSTEAKLAEADFFFRQMMSCQHAEPQHFKWYLSAFLSAGRSLL